MKTQVNRARKAAARSSKRNGRYWFAVGAAGLVACGVTGGPAVPAGYAQAPQSADGAAAATRTFDIAAGPLADVIAAFEKVTGLRVVMTRLDLGMLPSPGVRGELTPDRALAAILSGTSVSSAYVSANEISLSLEARSVTVEVATGPELAPSSPKYVGTLRDVPQTISVIPRGIIEQQGAMTLSDVARNFAGITLQAGEGGGASSTTGDMLNIRGFNASNNIFKDGVRDDGLISRNVYNLEQVEAFLGPTGSDTGRGTASGYINMQTKTPSLRSAYAATFAYASANQTRSTFDFNQPLRLGRPGSWLSRAAARLNALWQEGGVPGRDEVKLSNRSIAPAIALGLGSTTRVFYSGEFTRQNNVPDYGVPTAAWLNGDVRSDLSPATAPVRLANYYGSLNYDFDDVLQNTHTARIERDLSGSFTLRNQTRYNKTHRYAIVTGIGAFAPATEAVTLQRQGNQRTNRIVSNQTNLNGRFSFAGMAHALSAGAEYTYEDQFAPTLTGVGARAAVNIYSPDPQEAVTGYAPAQTGALTKGWTNTGALYAFDTVSLGERWQLSGGARWDRYTTNFRSIAANGSLTTDERAAGGLVSGKAGIMFRITEVANVYFSAGTSSTPPGTANFTLSAQANNQNNPNVQPQVSRNYEVGGKWDTFKNRLSLSAAAFHTRNDNVIFTIDATTTPPTFNQDDGQVVKGLTLGATGAVTQRINVLANWAWFNTRLETQNAANNGNRLTLTPARSGSFWATVALPRRFTAGGGVRYMSTVFVNAANTIRTPGSTIADAVIDYAVDQRLTLRFNINNLTNASYIRSVNNNGNRFNPGFPRSFMITTSVKL